MIQEINNEQNVNIASLTTDIKWIIKELHDIKDNHLKTIYKELRIMKGWVITSLLTILSALTIYLLTK